MYSINIIAAITFGLVSLVFQIFIILAFSKIRKEVNGIASANERVPVFGPSSERGRAIKLHKQYYPHSDLRRKFYVAWAGQVLFGMVALACVLQFKTEAGTYVHLTDFVKQFFDGR